MALLLLGLAATAHGQPAPPAPADPSAGIKGRRLAALATATAACHWVGFRYFDRAWYEGQKTDHIRWIYDWSGETYLNLDKGAHFMAGVAMAEGLGTALVWSGVEPLPAALVGTAASWAFLLEIEMRDAYYDQWGFSVPDFTANTVGAALPLLHQLVPRTRAIRAKFSYHPSSLYLDRQQRRQRNLPHTGHLIDDYEGMTFWLSVSPTELLPTWCSSWPAWANLACGYGAHGLHGDNVKSKGPNKRYPELPDAQPEVFLGLDLNTRPWPPHGRAGRWAHGGLQWLHLPSPAVRVTPSWGFYLLYM